MTEETKKEEVPAKEWEYSNYRATLKRNGEPFALLAEIETKMPSLDPDKAAELVEILNRKYGKIDGPKSLFMNQHVGKADDGEGKEYGLAAHMDFSPLIKSKTSGRYFTLGWMDIVRLAVAAGIDEPEEVQP